MESAKRIFQITKTPLIGWIIVKTYPDKSFLLKKYKLSQSDKKCLTANEVNEFEKENFPQLHELENI
jgi:hypothetical protein